MRKRARQKHHHLQIAGLLFGLAFFSQHTYSKTTDCINEAARCFHINPLVIKAIIWQESRVKQNTINVNKNFSQDVGMMQINSLHFTTLSKMGISEQALLGNSCINIFSGTYLLHQAIRKYGYNWDGIGHYHSRTKKHRRRYINQLLYSFKNEIKQIESIHISSSLTDKTTLLFTHYCVVPLPN